MKKSSACKFIAVFAMVFLVSNIAFSRKWWEEAVMYEIFVRSFYDSTGDGIGDIPGLIKKLDYLNDGNPETTSDLGIDAIWLMPIFATESYHGYDTVCYYTINPEYGTMEDFENLIKEAHRRGIKIILDLVINHSSHNHEWFHKSARREGKYTDYYLWKDEIPEGWGRPWGGGRPHDVWINNRERGEYYYAAFSTRMPDLNHQNENVWKEFTAITKFWLDKGVDGFRLDAARYLIETGPGDGQADTPETLEWWKRFNAYVKSLNPNALIIGEVWTGNQIVHKYYMDGKGLDMCFDFEYADNILMGVGYNHVANWRNAVTRRQEYSAPDKYYSPFLSNHDTIRSMNILRRNFNNAKLAAAVLLTSSGMPMLYYGEEIGMYQDEGRGDPLKRTPMQWTTDTYGGFSSATPWTSLVTTSHPFTVASQDEEETSLLNHYRRLIRIRRDNPEFKSGDMEFIEVIQEFRDTMRPSSRVVAFIRDDKKGNKSVIIANFSNSYQGAYIDFVEGNNFFDLLSEREFSYKNNRVRLAPKQILILKKK